MENELDKAISWYVTEQKRMEKECLEMWDKIFKITKKRKKNEEFRKVSTRRKI